MEIIYSSNSQYYGMVFFHSLDAASLAEDLFDACDKGPLPVPPRVQKAINAYYATGKANNEADDMEAIRRLEEAEDALTPKESRLMDDILSIGYLRTRIVQGSNSVSVYRYWSLGQNIRKDALLFAKSVNAPCCFFFGVDRILFGYGAVRDTKKTYGLICDEGWDKELGIQLPKSAPDLALVEKAAGLNEGELSFLRTENAATAARKMISLFSNPISFDLVEKECEFVKKEGICELYKAKYGS